MVYQLVRPMVTDGDIIGYEIKDTNGQIRKVKASDVIILAEKKMIDASIAVDSNGIKHINPEHKLNILEDAEIYTIEARFIKDGKLTGYKCKTISGNSVKMTPVKLWEFAAANQVTNAEAKIINDRLAVFGAGIKLGDLPVIKI